MGREAIATCHWRGDVAEAKVLLESQEIILRGAIRARVVRAGLTGISVAGDDLVLVADGEAMTISLGAVEAGKWADALRKSPPGLATKLGLSEARQGFLLGQSDDAVLKDAIAPYLADRVSEAAMLLAIITSEADISRALDVSRGAGGLPIWCLYPKGKAVVFGDTAIRTQMRAASYVDSKSCGVSDTLTATRYSAR